LIEVLVFKYLNRNTHSLSTAFGYTIPGSVVAVRSKKITLREQNRVINTCRKLRSLLDNCTVSLRIRKFIRVPPAITPMVITTPNQCGPINILKAFSSTVGSILLSEGGNSIRW